MRGIRFIFCWIAFWSTPASFGDESVTYVPIGVDSITIFIPYEPSHLPEDPGEDNDETLQGIDSNNNGIRDDIERYIAYEYIGNEYAGLRDQLKNFAYWQQQVILKNVTVVRNDAEKIVEAGVCVQQLLGEQAGHDAYAELIARHLNTVNRSYSYIDYLDFVQINNLAQNASSNPNCSL